MGLAVKQLAAWCATELNSKLSLLVKPQVLSEPAYSSSSEYDIIQTYIHNNKQISIS